jgi:hypothetical protein
MIECATNRIWGGAQIPFTREPEEDQSKHKTVPKGGSAGTTLRAGLSEGPPGRRGTKS